MSNAVQMEYLQVGKGKGRDYETIEKFIHNLPYQQGHKVTVAKIAKELGVAPHIAYDTVRGKRNNKRFLDKLQELGLSEKILYPQGA